MQYPQGASTDIPPTFLIPNPAKHALFFKKLDECELVDINNPALLEKIYAYIGPVPPLQSLDGPKLNFLTTLNTATYLKLQSWCKTVLSFIAFMTLTPPTWMQVMSKSLVSDPRATNSFLIRGHTRDIEKKRRLYGE